ncbi:hypothetical protein ACMFMG_000821 [Clarireedia jacksonii]
MNHFSADKSLGYEQARPKLGERFNEAVVLNELYSEHAKWHGEYDSDKGGQGEWQSEDLDGQENEEKNEEDNEKGKYRANEKPTAQDDSDEETKRDSKFRKYTSNFSTVSQDRTGGADQIGKSLLLLIG